MRTQGQAKDKLHQPIWSSDDIFRSIYPSDSDLEIIMWRPIIHLVFCFTVMASSGAGWFKFENSWMFDIAYFAILDLDLGSIEGSQRDNK